LEEFGDLVLFIDLGSLKDPLLVASATGVALGLPVNQRDPVPSLIAALRHRRMLLVFDSCEHVIETASALAERIFKEAPEVHILATSREVLNVEGEQVHRLAPLECPSEHTHPTAEEALNFPAVRLFVERATANQARFALSDTDAPVVAEICRKLDGIALAIELAAGRVSAYGIRGVATLLDQRLGLLWAGRRTALPRHRTLTATLDWSYDLLQELERTILRRLSVFAGSFTLEAARSVAAGDDLDDGLVVSAMGGLVTKSLVAADTSDAITHFRLLDTTRAYASQKLVESSEADRIAHRHAVYYRLLLGRIGTEAPGSGAELDRTGGMTEAWTGSQDRVIDNLRTALDWAFSHAGDGSLGVALTTAAVPLWTRLSLLEECRTRVNQALGALGTGVTRDPREEMRLYAALGASTPEALEMGEAFTKALDMAESLGDTEYQLRALRGLYFFHTGRNRYRAALPFAQRFHELALSRTNPSDRLFGERMIGVAKHFLGDQVRAWRHLEQVLTHSSTTDHGLDVIRFQIDSRLSARVFLARVLWLQGFPDQAVRTATISIGEAQASGHAASLCYSLALAACPIALWVGNLGAAAHYTTMLLDHSRAHSLTLWSEAGSRLQAVLDIKEGGLDTALTRSLSTTSAAGFTVELAEAFTRAGRIAEGLAVIEAGFDQSEAGWIAPEVFRLRGELLLSPGAPAAAETAESLFRQALDVARQQEALSWELRIATSLARLMRSQGRDADAIACLKPVFGRFTEGFGTADLISAKQLLDELSGASP
jgi:predicted ATPase